MDTKLFRETKDVLLSYIKYKHCSLIDCNKVTELNISNNLLNDQIINKINECKYSKNIYNSIIEIINNFSEWNVCIIILHITDILSLYYLHTKNNINDLITLISAALMEKNYNWMINNNGWDGFINFLK
ncbi:hypothetical protein EPTV-WA-142 [Eptesipox virus]|uniref:Uncharacterized protein n=1 Tax=Eptesipox virus TaxID=1329402 RepID=A0A220T6K8_9POXV|nr:hypothetical protein CG743_gp142 [Eptesipox virus]ASK51343.1 hypothetical protein EPTV-WA-142 [Eptesipox virus]WAH71101.1 hypothetical protein CG743_gp142 [Eptesipox virus]